jgi:hypothetical protein
MQAKAGHAVPGAGLSTSSVQGNEKKARATNGQRVMQQMPMMPFMLMAFRYTHSPDLPSPSFAPFPPIRPGPGSVVNLDNAPSRRALRAYARLHAFLHAALHIRSRPTP